MTRPAFRLRAVATGLVSALTLLVAACAAGPRPNAGPGAPGGPTAVRAEAAPGFVVRPAHLEALGARAYKVVTLIALRADALDEASVDALLGAREPDVRHAVAIWLDTFVERGLVPGSAARAACREALDSRPILPMHVDMAFALARSLRRQGIPGEDRVRLEALVDEAEPWQRWSFVQALSAAGVDPTSRLLAALDGKGRVIDPQVTRGRFAGMGLRWPSADLEPLWRALVDVGDVDAQKVARFALGQGPDALERLQGEARDVRQRIKEQRAESLDWRPADEAELLHAIAGARVVLFGEMHVTGGPLRAAQKEACAAFARGGGRLLLGYEPSVVNVQGEVAEFAEGLGFHAFALEGRTYDRAPYAFRDLRDVEAAKQALALLEGDPEARLLVLRGQSHTLRGGPLVAAFSPGATPSEPQGVDFTDEDLVVIHAGSMDGPSPAVWPAVDRSGAVFESARDPRFWAWCCDERSPSAEDYATLEPFLTGPWRDRPQRENGM